MRIILVFILFLLLGQQTTVNGQQTLCTVPEPVEGTTLGASTSSATAYTRTVDCCLLSVDFYESQIRKADSLYKNYLPQYNFDEVKAAMEFFDSIRNEELAIRNHGRRKAIPNSAFLIPNYQSAKAHYYHAVGLTEKDDIVGACEHYLTALEIMEFETENLRTSKSEKRSQSRKVARSQSDCLSDSATQIPCDPETLRPCDLNKEDYEKIRFLALTYNRLGRLFYNENYCDLAILKYKKALNCLNIIKDSIPISYTYKNIGNVYQLLGKADSALYHYRKSLEINSGLTNKLDIDKNIAQILFEKGEKDSAYILIKENMNKIENINIRYSYYTTIGDMFFNDKNYDSAAYYLKECLKSDNNYIIHMSASRLSSLYDSLGNYVKKAYYDDIVSKLSIINVNRNFETNKLQDVYDKYKERKAEKEKIKSRTRTKVIAISLSLLIIISFVIIILIWHKSKRKDRLHQESLNEKDRYIANKEEIISKTNEEIKRNESEIKKLVEIIGNLKSDINSLKDDAAIKEEEISDKETDIKKMENDLSAKERELKRLQENVHENRILIDRLNEDNIAKEKQIECYLEEIDDNRQVINDKNHLISIATEGLVARKDAIAENRNEIARLQAIIGKNEKFLNKLSEDYRNNKEQMAVYLDEIEKLKTEINQAQIDIKDLRFKNSFTEGKIKKQNAELKNKEELIGRYTTEISELKNKLDIIDSDNNDNAYTPKTGMDLYLQSKVCSKILNEINELSAGNIDTNRLTPLRHEEFVVLLNAARLYLNNFNEIAVKHSQLKIDDLYYICLVILGLNDTQISSLFALSYTAINKKKKKIRHLFGLSPNEILYTYIINLCVVH